VDIRNPYLRAGELEMDQDEDNHAVALGGQRLKLTRKQYAILELLLLRKGQVVSKETLMDHLYGGSDEPSFRTIDVFVCLMRKRLAQIGCEGLIKTIRGSGYLLEAQHAPCLAFGAPLPARHLPRDALAA
jgi:two-component system cell cycle response regulator CtrA